MRRQQALTGLSGANATSGPQSCRAALLLAQFFQLGKGSLTALAVDPHVRQWQAKENNWVSYFAFKYLVGQCRPDGVITDPAQISVEVSVPQPPQWERRGVRRDIVIWPSAGMTCWSDKWACHPMAIWNGRCTDLVAGISSLLESEGGSANIVDGKGPSWLTPLKWTAADSR